jgi:hypothetical protein
MKIMEYFEEERLKILAVNLVDQILPDEIFEGDKDDFYKSVYVSLKAWVPYSTHYQYTMPYDEIITTTSIVNGVTYKALKLFIRQYLPISPLSNEDKMRVSEYVLYLADRFLENF